ncbi:MAG: hypothetical protein AAFY26_14725 [Cyanobacteria bacterium J06638_22]
MTRSVLSISVTPLPVLSLVGDWGTAIAMRQHLINLEISYGF